MGDFMNLQHRKTPEKMSGWLDVTSHLTEWYFTSPQIEEQTCFVLKGTSKNVLVAMV